MSTQAVGAAARILRCLEAVQLERHRRECNPDLAASVSAIKAYQHARFAATYSDLLASTRYSAAAGFFLDDLYGPTDFTQRDQQFARVVPALVRLFPGEIVRTVECLAELHALSEFLDSEMAVALGSASLDNASYVQTWVAVGDKDQRERQIVLMVEVGSALDRYTRKLLLRQTLKLMRAPAQAAGLGALQLFLEKGFDTFRAMAGAEEFLDTVARRERALAEQLFAGEPISSASG